MLVLALSVAFAQDPAPMIDAASAGTAPAEVAAQVEPAPPEDGPPAEPAPPTEAEPLGPDGLPAWYPRYEKPKPPPTHRLWYRSSTFARVNPLGLQSILDLGWRYQIIKRVGTFYNDSYLFIGPTVNASPSFVRAGLKVETMPISVLRFHASYQGIVYTGAFDNLSSFPSRDSDFSDRTMGEAGDAYVTTGGVFNLGWRFQFKIAAFAIRNVSELAYWHLNLREGDVAFYEQFWDRLIANNSLAVQNDLDILGAPGRTRIGVRYTYSDTLLGDDSLADQRNHRVGPLFAFEFHDRKPGARFNHPTLFVLAQWWLQHEYRTGQQQPWGLPLIAVGLTFDGDLLGERPAR